MSGGPRVAPAPVAVVLACAVLWGLWWWPVGLLERAGVTGAWIGVGMVGAALPVSLAWAVLRPGGMSPRAVLGAASVGLAIALYGVAVYHTDFVRAVLLFYFAPAWSTLIEMLFFGRRWRWRTGLALASALVGVVLIASGGGSGDARDVPLGDAMALAGGLCWSIGSALLFSSRRAEIGRVLVVAALGGSAGALLVAAATGTLAAGAVLPSAIASAPGAFVFAAAYVSLVLAGTIWGAFRLPPAVISYLLSVEVLSGLVSAGLVLGERLGGVELAGAAFVLAAIAIEIIEARSAPVHSA